MKFTAMLMALLLLVPAYVVAQQEQNQWNETVTVPPTGTQIVLRHVSKGDLLEGNFSSDGGPVNFYVDLGDPFTSQVEYNLNRTNVPIYKANLKTGDNFSVAIPFDGTLIATFENPRMQSPVNVTYSLSYTADGASYLRQGRIYDDIVVLSPDNNTAIITIPYVFIGDEVNIRVYSLDGTVNVYTLLDTTVIRERLPAYYREIYPLVSQAIMNETVIVNQPVFASGTLAVVINNPTVNSNRTVVYSIQCRERGPIMRVVLTGLEHGRIILPLGITLDIPSGGTATLPFCGSVEIPDFADLTTGALITFTIQIYDFMSRMYHFIIGVPAAGPVIQRIWEIAYGIIMPLWAY